ncbi:hypothetical protein GGS26DRAFT_589477 [Hypomontagnella submonticulosa]|nr:hypothetical protein GGS26DRAFT_589477 [Hypomontagnella submonticulosa]
MLEYITWDCHHGTLQLTFHILTYRRFSIRYDIPLFLFPHYQSGLQVDLLDISYLPNEYSLHIFLALKINGILSTIGIALFVNFTLVSGCVLVSRDLITPIDNDLLLPRSESGNSQGGSSSSSASKCGKNSQLKKGATREAADAELGAWGLQRIRHEANDAPPKPFHWDDEGNEVYKAVEGTWKVSSIKADSDHAAKYGTSDVYRYQTNVDAGAFHTDAVYTTEDGNGRARRLPANRRALTYNAWIEAGGDPADLLRLSDDNIENEDAKKAFQAVLDAKQAEVTTSASGERWVQVSTQDEAWAQWDNGNNPFPAGYRKMAEDYPDMQSQLESVMLYIDATEEYNTVHFMESYESLDEKRRRQTKAQ